MTTTKSRADLDAACLERWEAAQAVGQVYGVIPSCGAGCLWGHPDCPATTTGAVYQLTFAVEADGAFRMVSSKHQPDGTAYHDTDDEAIDAVSFSGDERPEASSAPTPHRADLATALLEGLPRADLLAVRERIDAALRAGAPCDRAAIPAEPTEQALAVLDRVVPVLGELPEDAWERIALDAACCGSESGAEAEAVLGRVEGQEERARVRSALEVVGVALIALEEQENEAISVLADLVVSFTRVEPGSAFRAAVNRRRAAVRALTEAQHAAF